MRARSCILGGAAAGALLLTASAAAAQANRTWISGLGDDANPCSRTAPCKTFAGALGKTGPHGEISVLDPGGYGWVTITKPISLVADGQEGGVLAPQVTGVTVRAGPADTVYLRGLIIQGDGSGLSGVKVVSAGAVTLDRVVIRGFQGPAVQVQGPAKVTIAGSTLVDNQVGVSAEGAGARVWIAGSTVANNDVALTATAGASIASYGDNAIHANRTDGAGWTTTPRR